MREQNPFCMRCGVDIDSARAEGRPLQTHHLHYETLGHEEEEDVEVLCRECHMVNEHGKDDYDGDNY